jgi:hypothetical protein
VCALAGCGAPHSASAEKCGEAPVAAAGELKTILRASAFGADALILGSAALPGGSIVVAYEGNPEEAGGEEGWTPDPGLVLLGEDGSCAPFPAPSVDGVRVGLDAQPVAVDSDGRLYLWDPDDRRVVREKVGGSWEMVTMLPERFLSYQPTPDVAVDPDGDVYLSGDYRVSRVTATGSLEDVAGNGEQGRTAEAGTKNLPRPGTSAPLPEVRAIRSTPSGALVMATKSAVMTLDAGTLSLLADKNSTAAEEARLTERTQLTALEVTPSGDVLVSDLPGRRILRLREQAVTVLVESPSYLSLSPGGALLPDGAALLVHQDGGQSLAVYGMSSD